MAKKKIVSIHSKPARSYDAKLARENNVIGAKIAELRERANLSCSEFSELLNSTGVSVRGPAINKWENGESAPSSYQLLAICAAFGIEDVLGTFDRAFDLGYTPALNEAGRRKVREYIDDLVASGKYRPKPVAELIEMPISNLAVSAGTGAFLDEGSFEIMSFPKESVPKGADFGIRVSGDSMEPIYHDGQIVWVQRCNELSPGEVGVFSYDGEGYLKQYEEWEPVDVERDQYVDSDNVLHKQPVLISYNEKYAPKRVSANVAFRVEGRVLN